MTTAPYRATFSGGPLNGTTMTFPSYAALMRTAGARELLVPAGVDAAGVEQWHRYDLGTFVTGGDDPSQPDSCAHCFSYSGVVSRPRAQVRVRQLVTEAAPALW